MALETHNMFVNDSIYTYLNIQHPPSAYIDLLITVYLSYPSWIEGFFPTLPPPLLRLPKAQSSGSGSDDVATAGGDKSITQWEMVEVEAKELTIRRGPLVAWGGLKRFFGVETRRKEATTKKGTKKVQLKRMFEEWNDYDDYGWPGKRTFKTALIFLVAVQAGRFEHV